MTRLIRVGLLAAITVFVASAGVLANSPTTGNRVSREAFRAEMRVLWTDHVVWTRQYIVSAATLPADLPDLAPTADRLFANQADIGEAVADFYGEAAGAALTELLDEHIALAAEAIAFAKQGDDAALDDALARWYTNADEISAFLNAANPRSWPLDEMQAHMRHHLDLTLAEAVARLGRDYAADIAAYDEVQRQILHLADMLSAGIIDQFPQRFSR